MPVQFTGTLAPGQYQEWSTWGWNRDYLVEWSVRPSPGQVGPVSLRALAIEGARDGTLTYMLTVWNVGSEPATFEALYTLTTSGQSVVDDAHGAYTLDAGQTIYLTWDLGLAPTLVSLIAVPEDPGASFVCSTPSVVLNGDGTGTYSFAVTNTGAEQAAFRMRAGLSWPIVTD
jgi:hypothetical protein